MTGRTHTDRWRSFLTALFWLAAGASVLAEETPAPWAALLEDGNVVIMRHALAPGTGDPATFRIGDCSTQRNLSGAGREQATRIGERLREHGVSAARVYSSQWCRCLDTAQLLNFGEVTPLPALNSFFRDRSTAGEQTAALREFILEHAGETLLILVTHQVNITELTGVYPASGEMLVMRPQDDELILVGRIP
jgi:phosphohistidine phosphatase SixA